MTSVFIGDKEKIQRHRGKDHVKTEAKTGVTQPQAKDLLEPLQEAGRGKEGVSPEAFRGIKALPTPWFQTSGFQN